MEGGRFGGREGGGRGAVANHERGGVESGGREGKDERGREGSGGPVDCVPREQVVRYMIRRGWQVDGQYLAATIHEPRTPSRVNACHMLHKYPQICDKPESQKLINLVIYGESARNHTGADLDLDFGEARETACPGMPSFQQLYSLSLEEAKLVQATQRMPDGGVATLREAYRHGDALIVDTRAPPLKPAVQTSAA